MQDDPFRYWQDLTENYRQMSDGELLELAAKPEDLTDVARQVLRDEMRKRRLNESRPPDVPTRSTFTPRRATVPIMTPLTNPDLDVPDSEEAEEDDASSQDYTWKTLLCECSEREQALQLSEALKQAGIESWLEPPKSPVDLSYCRLLV